MMQLPVYSSPLHELQTNQFISDFSRVGCALLTGVLDQAEVAALRAKVDAYAGDPAAPAKHISYAGTTLVLRRCHEMDPLFESMITHPEIRKIAEAAVGSDARFNASNAIATNRDRQSPIGMWTTWWNSHCRTRFHDSI